MHIVHLEKKDNKDRKNITYLINYRSINRKNILGCVIAPVSVVLQVIAVGHIIFYKLKYRYLDNRVKPIQLNQENGNNIQGGNSNEQDVEGMQINTNPYNEIIFNVSTVISWLFIFTCCNILIYVLEAFPESNNQTIYYAMDFVPLFVTNVVLPSLFFIVSRHKRVFIKQLCLCK